MSLKIPGIEEQSAAPTAGLAASEAPQQSNPVAGVEPTQEPKMRNKQPATVRPAKSFAAPLAVMALVTSAAALGCAFTLQLKFDALNVRLARAQATADAALRAIKSIPTPMDFTPDIARIEATLVSKFRVVDQYLQQTIPDEFKKVAALENRLAADRKDTAASQANTTQAIQQLRESARKTDERLTNVIAVLRNQDKVLRQLVQKENPETQ